MTYKLVHKLKQRGYKHNEIINHIKDIPFSERKETLTRKQKPKQTDKLIFVTQYTDDIHRIKRIFKKHWTLIKNNKYLKQIFPSPPVIACRANPSLKNKVVRAKLKPLQPTEPNTHPNLDRGATPESHEEPYIEPNHEESHIEPNYPFNLFETTSQNFRNPIKRCIKTCSICTKLETKSFAYSTTRSTKTPINPPPPNQNFNCQSRNVVYLITCRYKHCGAQYVGYTMRQLRERRIEHKTNYDSQIHRHMVGKHHFKLVFQILCQAPDNELNPELWLKQQEYYWICKLGTLTKFNPKGLNKLVYDPTI